MLLYARNNIVVKIMVPYGLSWHRHNTNTYRDLTVFFGGGARQECSARIILCRILWDINVPLSQRMRSIDNPPNPTPPIGDHSGMRARANTAESPVRGSICLASPYLGGLGGGGAYIYWRICGTLPLAGRPLGTSNRLLKVARFCILIRGGLLMDRCHPATRQMVKIRRLGIELPMLTAIRTSGHNRGR